MLLNLVKLNYVRGHAPESLETTFVMQFVAVAVATCTVAFGDFVARQSCATKSQLEMWANAQPDGRPAEYR